MYNISHTPHKLAEHRKTWENKEILREVYTQWYKTILADMASGRGKTIELGAGSGNFKAFKPDVISSDIEYCEWLDLCFDAHYLPFSDNSLSNIVMIDVLHHLSNPLIFLKEAARVLESKGKIIIIEPFPSPISAIIYKLFHPEPFIMQADYFSKETVDKKDPWDANQAIAYLLFFRDYRKLEQQFGETFNLAKKYRMSCLLYPASGGFENKQLIPNFLIPTFKVLEKLCFPLTWLMAFRCYIVLEKK